MNHYQTPNVRRDPIVPALAGKSAMMVGLGGGAPIAIHLMQLGISRLELVDFDTLGAENLIRHPCGAQHIGLPKVEAMTRHIREMTQGSGIEVFPHPFNIFDDTAATRAIMERSDVVIVATDGNASRFRLAEIANDLGKPAIFVGMFDGFAGGEVFVQEPKQPCYLCLAQYLGRKEAVDRYESTLEKKTCVTANDVTAGPGIGMHQSILCSIAAHKAAEVLLSGTEHRLGHIGENWIVFSISGIPGFLDGPLSSYHGTVPRHEHCFVCGG